mmetsp:Transcript_61781/g.194904  ORF Transcript_61781/g.194904 Transcript_61781/m.194904 type:complete len:87 (+) Transcript_61781:833-1093(+)
MGYVLCGLVLRWKEPTGPLRRWQRLLTVPIKGVVDTAAGAFELPLPVADWHQLKAHHPREGSPGLQFVVQFRNALCLICFIASVNG